MISAEAYAKVNFGLRVGSLREDGFHPVSGIFQSIAITDRLGLQAADDDSISSSSGQPAVDGLDNLAFRAVAAVRATSGASQPVKVTLDKQIPTAAGLGGGSADAAAALAMAGRYFGADKAALAQIAPDLGSDVPFCLQGGTARVSGRGEFVDPIDPLNGFALAVVVPPVEISTPAAFRCWDELGEPKALRISQRALPPTLRAEGDLSNDLYPAAATLVPELDDWRAALKDAWSRPVMLSGSGPALYSFFLDAEEAAEAAAAIPIGARFAEACTLLPIGWRITDSA